LFGEITAGTIDSAVSTQDARRRRTTKTKGTVEERLDRLEKVVDQVLCRLSGEKPRTKDWRRTIGMFDGDPVMKEILDGALLSREEERRQFYQEYDRQDGKS
jgi:hypothetical protein